MDSPSYAVLSEAYLQHHENNNIIHILNKNKFLDYFKQVDDILIIYDKNVSIIMFVIGNFQHQSKTIILLRT